MDCYQIWALLLCFFDLVHARYAKLPGGVADCDETFPLLYDKGFTSVKTKSDSFAGCIERITIAERDDPERVSHAEIARMQVAVSDFREKVIVVLS